MIAWRGLLAVFASMVARAWPPRDSAAAGVRAGKVDEGAPNRGTVMVGRYGLECLLREGRAPSIQAALAGRLRAALRLA